MQNGSETDRPCSVLSPLNSLDWTSSKQQQQQQQYSPPHHGGGVHPHSPVRCEDCQERNSKEALLQLGSHCLKVFHEGDEVWVQNPNAGVWNSWAHALPVIFFQKSLVSRSNFTSVYKVPPSPQKFQNSYLPLPPPHSLSGT